MLLIRNILLICFCLTSTSVISQDKVKLQKQFTELLLAYPQKFVDNETEIDGASITTIVPGTSKVQVMAIITNIQVPKDGSIVDVFEKWEDVIKSIKLNGAKLVPAQVARSSFWNLKNLWKLDDSQQNLDSKYKGFHVFLGLLKANDNYSISLIFGDKD
jgi:hypothetical protein